MLSYDRFVLAGVRRRGETDLVAHSNAPPRCPIAVMSPPLVCIPFYWVEVAGVIDDLNTSN